MGGRLLIENYSTWFIWIALAHKVTVGFAVVGVINGVVLQETFKVAKTDDVIMVREKRKEKKTMYKKMHQLFTALDVSDDGQLGYKEFDLISHHPDVQLWLSSL